MSSRMPAIHHDPTLRYPDARDAYAPGRAVPELPDVRPGATPNPVYDAVRDVLRLAGLHAAAAGTPDWNPLRDLVPEGGRVFLLCNFVYHRRPNESAEAFLSKCTHASVLRPLVDYALKAVGPKGRVYFGNAPLQSCDWKAVLRDTGADVLLEHYRAIGAPVEARDLRLLVAQRSTLGHTTEMERRDQAANAIEVELGAESLLDALYAGDEPRFRVADYDPRRVEAFHSRGSHRYVMHRAVLESDLVLSVPKLKTHEKVGITCGLKGFVGAVGHKDCLAHHRFGGPERGGDEYPKGTAARHSLSAFHDRVQEQRSDAAGAAATMLQVADKLARRVLGRSGAIQGGAWYGNDTAWRMTVDLARILHYADLRGAMQAVPQRRHYCVIDGIVGGEGEGPLRPDPVPAGILLAGEHAEQVDWVAARVMGYDPARIPLLREAFVPRAHPLSAAPPEAANVDGRTVAIEGIGPAAGRPFVPPPGWQGYLDGTGEGAR